MCGKWNSGVCACAYCRVRTRSQLFFVFKKRIWYASPSTSAMWRVCFRFLASIARRWWAMSMYYFCVTAAVGCSVNREHRAMLRTTRVNMRVCRKWCGRHIDFRMRCKTMLPKHLPPPSRRVYILTSFSLTYSRRQFDQRFNEKEEKKNGKNIIDEIEFVRFRLHDFVFFSRSLCTRRMMRRLSISTDVGLWPDQTKPINVLCNVH